MDGLLHMVRIALIETLLTYAIRLAPDDEIGRDLVDVIGRWAKRQGDRLDRAA